MNWCYYARRVIQGDEWYLPILEQLKFTRFPARIKAKTLSSVMSSLFQANANIKIILINCNLVPDFGRFPEQMPRNYRFVPETGQFSEQTLEKQRFVPKIKGFWEQMYWKGCLKSVQGARYTATGALIAGQGS